MSTKTSKPPTQADAEKLAEAIHNLGDFAHVRIRLARGHLEICPDKDPVARATPLGGGQYGLSFRSHTGRWERMPFTRPLEALADDIVSALVALHSEDDRLDPVSPSGVEGRLCERRHSVLDSARTKRRPVKTTVRSY